jgi:type I restriction enzyme S subunit
MSSKTKTTDTKDEATPTFVPKLRFPEFQEAEGWAQKEVGEVFQVTRGDVLSMTLVQDEKTVAMPYPVYSSQTKNNGLSGYYSDYLFEDAITWTTDGANAGDVNFRTGKFFCTNVCGVLLNSKGYANPCIAALINRVSAKYVSYVGNPKLMNGVMSKIPIPFPSIPEQQKIAECLSSVDELMAAQARKVDALKTHKKGLMQHLFPREGETQPRLRFPEFQNDGEWVEKTLGQVAKYENGKAHEQDIADAGNFIVVNSKFISTEGEVRKFTNSDFCIAQRDDILMVLSDVPNGRAIAKCFFVDADNLYTVNQRICKLTPYKAASILLFYVLNRNSYFLAFDDGVKQTNLKKDDVLDCPILLPTDIKEQQKIADCLLNIDALVTAETQKLEALKTHKKGLMQQLFPSPKEVEA